jgi:hypothetical protein
MRVPPSALFLERNAPSTSRVPLEVSELWRADFDERDYPQGVPPVAGVFGDATDRVWIGLTEPPPERLPSGELVAIRRWMVFEDNSTTDSDDTSSSGS